MRASDSDSDRDADLFIAGEWLGVNPVLKRYEYPTRELLIVRSISEAIECSASRWLHSQRPRPPGWRYGGALWVLGRPLRRRGGP